ncbi:MAG: hypothetical protein A2Y41_05885 [Spirochaetes bacterium GWB1_36_13]|nr:MAG: hypothetical protein A2Y41_05885 [Spirochaetes bacterium GWB1_36_13]
MKFIVIGKEGFIAQKLIKKIEKKYKYMTTSIDVSSLESVFLDLEKPDQFDYNIIEKDDFIVFLAAISSPDICKNNYNLAYQINVEGTRYFIEKALLRRARILFFSSDTVYGSSGEKLNDSIICFDENSKCFPIGEYGNMKQEIERNFENEDNFKVFRMSYVFSKKDKFSSYIYNCYKNKEKAEVFHPFYRNVVYIEDVLDSIENLYKNWSQFENKYFNLCGKELVSRKDIVKFIYENFKEKLNYNIIEPDRDFFSARPKIISTRSNYLSFLLGREPYSIQEALKLEFKEDIKNG